jgi:CRP-like cAMP-binding protein
MIERCKLFVGVEPEEIARISNRCKPVAYHEGDCIVRADTVGDALYILVEGNVSIRIGESDEITLAQHTKPGAFFGEIALVDSGPRSASVVAETDSKLLQLPIDVLEDCFRGNAAIEARIMRNLAVALAAFLRRANTERTRS